MSVTNSQLLEIPGVSQLQYADEAFFRAIFPKDALHYSYSWLYILRAAHLHGGNLGYKYVSHELVAVIGYRNKSIYITPIADTTKGVETQQLCQEIATRTDRQVIIKKAPIELSERPAFREPSVADLLEDDANPETVLQLQRLFTSADGEINPYAERLARKVRAFDGRSKAVEIVEDPRVVALSEFEAFFRMDQEKYENYMPLLKYLHKQAPKNARYKYKTIIFMVNKEIRGVYIAEVLSLTELGFYCGVTSKDEAGLTEWMDAYFFRKMFLEGIKTVYLGGSEKNGIAHFVKKLLPYKPQYSVKAVVFDPDTATINQSQVVIRHARETDVKALANLYRAFYNDIEELGERWTSESARKLISHFYKCQPDLFYVAEKDDLIIGAAVAVVRPWWDGNHLVNEEVFINPDYMEQGIEHKLLRVLLLQARDTYKVVAWDAIIPTVKQHPLAEYKKIGFSKVPEWSSVTGDTHKMLALLETNGETCIHR
jgi:N-acetylglutamate synthase-like GNAT family acetyltransferase